MTGDLVIGRLRATGLYRVHPTRDMRHLRPCGRCRPCPAAHQYARMRSRAHRIGAPKEGNRPRCALNGPVLAQIARRSCPRTPRSQAWSGQSAPVRRTSGPMTQSAHGQICGLTARAPRPGLQGGRMPKNRVDPSHAVSATVVTNEVFG